MSTYHFLFNISDDSYNCHTDDLDNFTRAQFNDPACYYVSLDLDNIDEFDNITNTRYDIINNTITNLSFESDDTVETTKQFTMDDEITEENLLKLKDDFIEIINSIKEDSENSLEETMKDANFALFVREVENRLGVSLVRNIIEDGFVSLEEEEMLNKKIKLLTSERPEI